MKPLCFALFSVGIALFSTPACTSMGGAPAAVDSTEDMQVPDGGGRPDGASPDGGGGGDGGGDGGIKPDPPKPWAPARGLYGGLVKSVAIDPKTPTTLWAGTDSAGIFKSTDGGATWSPSGCAGRGVPLLGVDATNPNIVFAGCAAISSRGAQEILRSLDGGATWTHMNVTAEFDYLYALSVHPKTSGVVYVQSATHVYKTVDGGMNWGLADGGLTARYSAAAIAVDPIDANIIYYLPPGGPYKSTDGGVTSTRRASGIPTVPSYGALWAIAIDPHAPQTLYISTINVGKNNLFKTTDGALSWTEAAAPPQSSNTGGDALTVDSAGGIYSVWVSGTYSSVTKSTNGGASWTRISANLAPNLLQDIGVVVAADPTDARKLWMGLTVQGIASSTDGGSTWRASNVGITNADVTALAIAPSNASVVYAGLQNGRVYRSTDEGKSFTLPSTGALVIPERLRVTALAVHPTNPDIVYAGTSQDNIWGAGPIFPRSGVWKSIDGGATWYELNLGLSGDGLFVAQLVIDPSNPKTVYAGARYKTTDEGITWTPLASWGAYSLVLDPTDSKRLFISQNDGSAWLRSLDGGATLSGPWKSGMVVAGGADLLDGLRALAIDATTPTNYYACTSSGIHKSANAGSTWGHAAVGFMNDIYCVALVVAPSKPQRVFGLSNLGELYATDDGATTWRQIAKDLAHGASARTILAASPSHPDTILLGMTSSVGVLRTETAGK